jgi:putative transposase
MPNAYTQLYVHLVFGVKFRRAILHKRWKSNLFGLMGKIIHDEGCQVVRINGVEDHVHCLIRMKPDVSLSKLVQMVKGKSSKWINDHDLCVGKFSWQSGYGAFTCGRLDVPRVVRYIENQEAYHRKTTFQEEYVKLLQQMQIEFDQRFIFQDLV